jgi:hypothetical protein
MGLKTMRGEMKNQYNTTLQDFKWNDIVPIHTRRKENYILPVCIAKSSSDNTKHELRLKLK